MYVSLFKLQNSRMVIKKVLYAITHEDWTKVFGGTYFAVSSFGQVIPLLQSANNLCNIGCSLSVSSLKFK